MKKMLLGLKLFKKNIFLNLISSFQLGIVLIIVAFVISLYSFLSLGDKKIEPVSNENFVYYTYNSSPFVFPSEAETKNDNLENAHTKDENIPENPIDVSQLKGVKSILNYSYTEANTNYDYSGKTFSVRGYNDETLKYFPIDTERNAPMPKENADYFEALISEEDATIKVGDIKTLCFRTNEKGVSKQKQYKVKIIGALKSPAYILGCNSSGAISPISLFENVNLDIREQATLIFNKEQLLKSDISVLEPDNKIIVFEKDLPLEDMDENMAKMLRSGTVLKLEDLKENQQEDENYLLQKYMPSIIMLMILSLSGMVGISIINTTKSIKTLKLFFICGLKWRQCCMLILTSILSSVLIVGIPILAFVGIYDYLGWEFLNLVNITFETYGIMILIMFLYAIIAFITPLMILHKNRPYDI